MLGYIALQFSHIRVYVTIPCYNPYYTGVSYCAMFYRINLRYVVFGYCIACYVKKCYIVLLLCITLCSTANGPVSYYDVSLSSISIFWHMFITSCIIKFISSFTCWF